MTPEEIVKRLRGRRCMTMDEAADLIERQAKALEEAEKALNHAAKAGDWTAIEVDMFRDAIATIMAARVDKEDDEHRIHHWSDND